MTNLRAFLESLTFCLAFPAVVLLCWYVWWQIEEDMEEED